MDYEKLLRKYIAHVSSSEGSAFISSSEFHGIRDLFTAEEWAVLERLEREAITEFNTIDVDDLG